MQPNLSAKEARVIGCLIEKSITTPDQYPLTLNALVNACNQKTSRDPVMSLQKGEVQKTARDLAAKSLIHINEDFRSRTEKYVQRFCNTRFAEYQFDPAELAIVCLLLLRGAQTPGELRTRGSRLHAFADNEEVVAALRRLAEHDRGPLVVTLPREKGRKDAQYLHLFSGPVDLEAYARQVEAAAPSTAPRNSVAELAARIERLETDVEELRRRLGDTT